MTADFRIWGSRMIAVLISLTWPLTVGAQVQSQAAGGQIVSVVPGDKAERQFQEARENFLRKEYQEAAAGIHRGAAFLDQEAEQAAGEGKRVLLASSKELKQLADRERKGAVNSVQELTQAFARANRALAQYYQSKASESWARKAFSDAGRYLQAAAVSLERALGWADYRWEGETRETIAAAKTIGEKMKEGGGWIEAEARMAIEALETEIGKVGSQTGFLKPFVPPALAVEEKTGGPVDLSSAIIQIAKRNLPAVVYIEVTESRVVENPFFDFGGGAFSRRYFGLPSMPRKFKEEVKGLGSGMIIDSQGHILTNNHVAGGATKLQVTLADGRQYPARLVGADPQTDLAVIQISPEQNLPFVTFGDSDRVEVGEWVVAIGAPRALEKSVTQGIVSAKHRTGVTLPTSYQDFLQTDAPLNPGNSGGPLLNLYGQVIGVNAAISSESGGFEGIGFTIPSNMAVYVAEALIARGKVERGWLGVTIRSLTSELAQSLRLETLKGALVVDVVKGSPADKAGIRKNDVVIAYGSKEILDSSALRNQVAETPMGKEVKITVLREGKKEELMVKIGSQEEAAKALAASVKRCLGAEVRLPASGEVEKYNLSPNQGVVIIWLDPKGPLAEAGFERGDMILEINDQTVGGMESFVDLVSTLRPKQKVSILALDHRTGSSVPVFVVVR